MNVWIVNPFDNLPSEGNRPQRYWLMAEAFVRAGHRVVYWTSDFSHATKKKRVTDKTCGGDEGEKEIEVVQIPTLPYKKNICWARVRSHRQLAKDFAQLATQKLSHSQNNPVLIIASTPPLGLCAAALRVARTCGAKFVCDIQDAWPETFERILPRFVWKVLGMCRVAKRLYCDADGVSAVAKRYLELAKEYGCCKPTHLAGHAIDISHKENGDLVSNRGEGERGSALRLVYAGNMSLSYDLETLIKAIQELPHMTLDIAGNGPDIDHLKLLTSAPLPHGPDNIRFHGYLGEQALAELLGSCDVGIIPMYPESCVGVPGKLADYAAAGLQVIESLGGECQEIVKQYHVGVHYTAGDVASLKGALEKISHLERVDPSDFARHFNAKTIMDEYVTWCKEIMR